MAYTDLSITAHEPGHLGDLGSSRYGFENTRMRQACTMRLLKFYPKKIIYAPQNLILRFIFDQPLHRI
jgi:hypothetical protein